MGLIYIIYPSPSKIEDFSPLPRSYKSNEPGDTIQNPNIAAYYSFFRRAEITDFYKTNFQNLHFCNFFLNPLCNIAPIRLNHPPEYAYQYIRDQQMSTFLEEYTYPLRDSLFVNGYEPKIEHQIKRVPTNFFGSTIHIKGKFYNSKTTIRFYPSNIFIRVFVYLSVWFLAIYLVKVSRKALAQY